MDFKTIRILYFNTIQNELRNRVFLVFFALTILFVLATNALFSWVASGIEQQMFGMADRGLLAVVFFTGINAWNVLLGLVFGIDCIKKDIETASVEQILSFPVSRTGYVLVRAIGAWSMVVFYYVVSIAFACVLYAADLDDLGGAGFVAVRLGTSFLQGFAAVVVGLLVSLYFGRLASFFLSLIAMGAVAFAQSYADLKGTAQLLSADGSVWKLLALVCYYIFPRFVLMGDMAGKWLEGQVAAVGLALEVLHFSVATSIVLALALFVFGRKSF